MAKFNPQKESLSIAINRIADTFLRISLKNLYLDLTEVIIPFLQNSKTLKDRINNAMAANQFKQKLKGFIESPQPLARSKDELIEFLNEYHSWNQWNKFGNDFEEKLKKSREQIDQKENPEKYIYTSISPETRYPFEAIPRDLPFHLDISRGDLLQTKLLPTIRTENVKIQKIEDLVGLQIEIPNSFVVTYPIKAGTDTVLYPPSFNLLEGVFVDNPDDFDIQIQTDVKTSVPQTIKITNRSKRNTQVKILFSPAKLPERPNGSGAALYSNFHPGETVWQNRDEDLQKLYEYQVEKLDDFIGGKASVADINNSKFIQAGNKIEDIKPYHYWYIFEDILPTEIINDLVQVHQEYYQFIEDYTEDNLTESDLNELINKVAAIILKSGVIYKSNKDFPRTSPETYYTNALEKVFVRKFGQCQDLDDVVHFILFNMGMVVSSQGGYVPTSDKKAFGNNNFANEDTHVECCVYLKKYDGKNISYKRIHLNPVALTRKNPNSNEFGDGAYQNNPNNFKFPKPELSEQHENDDSHNQANQTSQRLNEFRKKVTGQISQRLLQTGQKILPKLPTIAPSLALSMLLSASGDPAIQKNLQNSKIIEPVSTEQQNSSILLIAGGLITAGLISSKNESESLESSPKIPQNIDYNPTITQNQLDNNAPANIPRHKIEINEKLLLGNLEQSEDERSLNNIQTANNTQLETLKIIEKHTKYETPEKQLELNEQLTNNFLQTLFFGNQIAQKYKYGVEKSDQFYGQNYFASPEFTEFLKNPDQTQQEIIRLIHLFSSKKVTIQNDYQHNQSTKSSDYLGINGSTGIMQNSFLFGNLGSFVNNNSFNPQFRYLTPESKANLKKFLIIIRKILNQLLNSEIKFSDQNEDYKEKILSGGKVKLELDQGKVEEVCNNLLMKISSL